MEGSKRYSFIVYLTWLRYIIKNVYPKQSKPVYIILDHSSKKTRSPHGIILESENEEDKV